MIDQERQVLVSVRAVVEAAARASHLLDGIAIGADGLPCARPRVETEADRLLAAYDAVIAALQSSPSREEREQALWEALVKVRAHTSYMNPSIELLSGLLASIERIVDAALKLDPTPTNGDGK